MGKKYGKLVARTLVFVLCYIYFFGLVSPMMAYSAGERTYKTVRVGWFDSYGFQDTDSDDGAKSGYSFEYLARIANYTNWKYEYIQGEWS